MQATSFGDLLKLQFPPETHIIGNGLLKKNSKLLIVASPKSYKSFVLNTIVVQLLTGGHLFGVFSSHAKARHDYFKVEPVKRVLLLEQELGLEDNRDRLKPFHESLSKDHQYLMENGLFVRSCDFTMRLDSKEGYDQIGSVISEVNPQVVCFDPLIKFHRKDENDPSAMNEVMCNMSSLMQELDFTSLMVHHINKSEDKKGLDLIRGASSIAGDLDTCLLLQLANRSAAVVKVETIMKRGKPVRQYLLKLNPASLRMEFLDWAKSKDGDSISTESAAKYEM